MIEELKIEESRLRMHYQRFWDSGMPKEAEIAFSAAEEMKEVLDTYNAGYPLLMHDWLILLWDIHPYEA